MVRENRLTLLMILPTVLFLVFLLWLPFLRGILMTFYSWPLGGGDPTWVGLDNYVALFTSDVFYTSLRATAVFATTTIFQLGIALVASLAVANIDSFKSLVSGIYLLPYTMPPVVTGTIWLFLLDPLLGPVFQFLTLEGYLQETIHWSSNGDMALGVITIVSAWTFWPFMFIVILASRENIPEEYYESARVYGANRVQMFRNVTFPQIKSAILVAVSIRIVWNLAKVSQPLQMTRGGPGNATSVLAILLYQEAFRNGALGRAYTVGLVLLVITLLAVIPFIWAFERQEERI